VLGPDHPRARLIRTQCEAFALPDYCPKRAALEASADALLAIHRDAWERALMRHTYGPTKADNARAVAKDTAAAIAECNCAVDPDEVRAVMWRNERWQQASPRTGVDVSLGAETTIEQPAKTPWSEAHAKLLDAKGAVKLVAK
jgi:hypothetical protein